MDLKDLQPIIDLMNSQEERLIRKIDTVHEDVKETRDQAKLTNGRLRTAEGNIIQLKSDVTFNKQEFESKIESAIQGLESKIDCTKNKLDNIEPAEKAIKIATFFIKKPKTFLFLIIGFIISVQFIVLEAIENNWILELIKFIKP